MKRLMILFLLLLICSVSFADTTPVTKVELNPLEQEVSWSVVQLYGTDGAWETCPTVEMRGRKVVSIYNPSASDDVYLSGVSYSTARNAAHGTLMPEERATFAVSFENHIYASSSTVMTIEVLELR